MTLFAKRTPVTVIPVAFVRGDFKPKFVPISRAPLGRVLNRAGRTLRLLEPFRALRAAEGRA